jgi:hypothetical protein
MLQLRKELAAAKTDHAKTNLQRQIDATDAQIDKLAYELYGLTEDEIKIVEAEAKISLVGSASEQSSLSQSPWSSE